MSSLMLVVRIGRPRASTPRPAPSGRAVARPLPIGVLALVDPAPEPSPALFAREVRPTPGPDALPRRWM